MEVLKREKNDKIFLLIRQLRQLICEIYVVSRRQVFNKKELAAALNQGRKSTYLDNFEQRYLSPLILRLFCRPSPQLLSLDMILAECKQFLDFLVMSKSILVNSGKSLDFVVSRIMKKYNCINNFVLIVCLQPASLLKVRLGHRYFLEISEIFSASNLIKNEALTQVFSCEF